MDYSKYNRENVLANVEKLIKESEEYKAAHPYCGYIKYPMDDVCDDLSIFDWWVDYLSRDKLLQMRSFLKLAGSLGYNGYVCFKVGATGCSNGMWAHKAETTTGYSPDGECLYRSFTPAYISYDAELADGTWLHDKLGTHDITLEQLKRALAG